MREYLRLPPLFDIHVHARTPGQEFKEDFTTASRAALAGGVTTFIDMPNNLDLIDRLGRLRTKRDLAGQTSLCDIGFYLGTMGDPDQNFAECEPYVFGLKIYMNNTTGGFIVNDPEKLDNIFRRWDFDKPILVHAEGNTLYKAIELADKYDRRLHVCHVSLEEEVNQIAQAKYIRGDKVTAEVTPHHLFKSKLWSPHAFNQMKPPLSGFSDMQVLWEALRDGTIDIVATDHAPHTRAEKLGTEPPSGVTGLETMLPLLLMAERAGEISLEKIREATHHNPKRIFGIPEQPNSHVVVERGSGWQIRGENLQTKAQLTPFEGETVMDRVVEVYLRGKPVYSYGDFFAEPGSGKILPMVV